MHSKKWLKWAIWLMVAFITLFFMSRAYYRLTDNFHLANMTYDLPHNPDWEIAPLNSAEQKQLNYILGQKFSYLGKGSQSYVFRSQDGNYVIKFFKFRHLKPSWIVEALPEWSFLKDYLEKVRERKNKLIRDVFSGYILGYEELPKDTGIVYIHFNKTKNLQRELEVTDKLGIKWSIDLDSIVFVIQENAKTTRKVIQEALNNNQLDLAKKRITEILEFYMYEYSHGIYDRDHGVFDNTGFAGDKPIHIDMGKFTKDENMKKPEYYKQDLKIIEAKFDGWLSRAYPKEYPELKEHIENEMSRLLE